MADLLGAGELLDVVVGQADGAQLAGVAGLDEDAPVVLDGGVVGGPVHLHEVDALDAEAAQGGVDLAAHRRRVAGAPVGLHRVVGIGDQAELGEDVRTLVVAHPGQRLGDDLLGVAEAVDRGGVDPVDAQLDCAAHGRHRVGVVLRTPAERPTASADRPGAVADGRDLQVGRAEPTLLHQGLPRENDRSSASVAGVAASHYRTIVLLRTDRDHHPQGFPCAVGAAGRASPRAGRPPGRRRGRPLLPAPSPGRSAGTRRCGPTGPWGWS